MKPDLYTKVVLTVIAIMLSVIACKPLVSPDTSASAQSAPFAGVQYAPDGDRPTFFDPRTGEIWKYHSSGSGGELLSKMKVSRLGEPLVVEVHAN